MLTLKVSNAYAITPGSSDLRAGVIGIWFCTAGNAVCLTSEGETITVAGAVGSFFECPIQKVTSATATVLGVLGR